MIGLSGIVIRSAEQAYILLHYRHLPRPAKAGLGAEGRDTEEEVMPEAGRYRSRTDNVMSHTTLGMAMAIVSRRPGIAPQPIAALSAAGGQMRVRRQSRRHTFACHSA